MSEPAWVPIGAASSPQTFFAIDFRNPQVGANAGNVYPAVNALTTYESWVWAFRQDVLGILYGIVRIPETASFTNAEVDLEFCANGTGAVQMYVYLNAIADGESLNPAAWQTYTGNFFTMPAGRVRKKAAFPTAPGILAPGDLVVVGIVHDGVAVQDTLAVPTELLSGYLVLS
jgi:hypothetical protein